MQGYVDFLYDTPAAGSVLRVNTGPGFGVQHMVVVAVPRDMAVPGSTRNNFYKEVKALK